jgi:hypothetical protein
MKPFHLCIAPEIDATEEETAGLGNFTGKPFATSGVENGQTQQIHWLGIPYFWIPPPGPGGSLFSVGEASLSLLRAEVTWVAL